MGVAVNFCTCFMCALAMVLFKKQRIQPGSWFNWTYVGYLLQVVGGLLNAIPMTVLPLNITAITGVNAIVLSAILARLILGEKLSFVRYTCLMLISISIILIVHFASFGNVSGLIIYRSLHKPHKLYYLIILSFFILLGAIYCIWREPSSRGLWSILAPITLATLYSGNDMVGKVCGELMTEFYGLNSTMCLVMLGYVFVAALALFSIYFAQIVYENTIVTNSMLIQTLTQIFFGNCNSLLIFEATIYNIPGYVYSVSFVYLNLIVYFRKTDSRDNRDSARAIKTYGSTGKKSGGGHNCEKLV